jgi:hypothetical protein
MDEETMEHDALHDIFDGIIEPTDMKFSALERITRNFSKDKGSSRYANTDGASASRIEENQVAWPDPPRRNSQVACSPFWGPWAQALGGLCRTVQCKSQLRHFVWLPTTKILRPGRETSAVD